MNKPIYMQIYDFLKQSIYEGKYKRGDKIPSEKELAEEWGVSVITSRKALDMLRNENIIVRHAGKGSFVNEMENVTDTQRNKKPLIGVIMTDFNESFGIGLLDGIEKGVDGKANFLFRRSFGDPVKEQQCIQDFLEQSVDGLIILPSHATHFNAAILQLVVDDYPLVLIDRYLRGLGATAIGTDNTKATIKGMEYLFDLGHESIMLLASPASYAVAAEDRVEGFQKAYHEYGISISKSSMVEVTSTLPNSFKEKNVLRDINRIKEQLKNNKNITAIFAIEYNIALLARQAIKELGMSCPDDISILCFDSPPFKPGSFSFTHLVQDQESIGKMAVEELLTILSSENAKEITLFDATLIEGQSTRKLNTQSNKKTILN